uniref:G_PROTEIN_RECEP_F1_2 domain-containing protein n=1 Tax=Rhabditophanes sp. KR3021 TaxID=114890 RepID=A0AC35TH14_9BILA
MVDFMSVFVWTVFILSLIGNILALSLMPHYKEANKYNAYIKLLFSQFVMDLIFAITTFVCRINVIAVSGYLSYFLHFFKDDGLSYEFYDACVCFYIITVYANLSFTTTNVVSRYLCVTNIIDFTHKHFVIGILLTIMFPIGWTTVYFFAFDRTIPRNFVYLENLKANDIDPEFNINSFGVGVEFFRLTSMVLILGYVVYISINCLIIFIAYRKLSIYLKEMTGHLSTETRKMNNEFMRIFIIQGIAPLFCSGIPLFIYILSIFTDAAWKKDGGTYVLISVGMTPFINSFLFLIILSKNRALFKRRLRRIGIDIDSRVVTLTT